MHPEQEKTIFEKLFAVVVILPFVGIYCLMVLI
jgi:F0F1-type ATP synthase membrane subunit c/vacuolar-type H+-ATPase subunit K